LDDADDDNNMDTFQTVGEEHRVLPCYQQKDKGKDKVTVNSLPLRLGDTLDNCLTVDDHNMASWNHYQ
jgi:hypothetical protein